MAESANYGWKSQVAGGDSRLRHALSDAELVLDYAPLLADEVIAGIASLDKAYEQARQLKVEQEKAEELSRNREALMGRLRAEGAKCPSMMHQLCDRERGGTGWALI